MGWFEVLALLKRVVPLLGRIAPMLEAFLASRAGGRADQSAAVEVLAEDLRGRLYASGERVNSIADVLAVQTGQIGSLVSDLKHLREAEDRGAARLLAMEYQLTALQKFLRITAVVVTLLLLLCAGLLIVLLRQR